MPTIDTSDETKQFILPSTVDKPEQGWVIMTVHPVCADDFITLAGLIPKEQNVNAHVLSQRIKDWNYIDKHTGEKLEVTPKNVGRLSYSDMKYLSEQIEDDESEVIAGDPKGTSSPTSSPEQTANVVTTPQV